MIDPVHGACPSGRGSRMWRRARTLTSSTVAVVAMASGASWFVGVSVLHDQVLDRGVYLSALDEAGTYRRLYSDVLTDAAVRALTDRAFEGLAGTGVDRQDAAAVANAALRLALPPAILRESTEALVSDVLSYLRGDRAALEAPVPVLHALGRIHPGAAAFADEVLSAASSLLLDHIEEVESFAQAVADGLADGQIPSMIPLVGGQPFAEDQLVAALEGLTAALVPADVREQVLAAVESREHRHALIVTALDALRTSLQKLSAELAADGDVNIDLIEVLVLASGQDRVALNARAESVRGLVARLPSASRYAGVALLLAGGAALTGLHRRRTSQAVTAMGVGLLSAGAVVWSGWMVVAQRRRLSAH